MPPAYLGREDLTKFMPKDYQETEALIKTPILAFTKNHEMKNNDQRASVIWFVVGLAIAGLAHDAEDFGIFGPLRGSFE